MGEEGDRYVLKIDKITQLARALIERTGHQLHGRFGWEQNESAAWTRSAGGMRAGEPDFSHVCCVDAHLPRPASKPSFPTAMWWAWSVKTVSAGVSYRARGYADSMENGKIACERAIHALALSAAAQFYGSP